MKGASLIAPFGLRMPEDLKEKIALRAKNNGRSMNAEIVQILQEAVAEPSEDSLAKAAHAADGTNLPPLTDDMKGWADHLRKRENMPELEALLRSVVKILAVVAPAISGEDGLQQILKNAVRPENIADAVSDKKDPDS
ncbi:Arc family DNA-binding protein [Enterobacter cloacae]|nr:Arc family DNA-binding protein [Enterobacter cloacae]